MRGMNDGCIDLIYLDPPFNSNKDYSKPIGSGRKKTKTENEADQVAAFKDTWKLSDGDIAWWREIHDSNIMLYNFLESIQLIHSKSMMSYMMYMAVRLMEMKRILKPTGSIFLHCDDTAGHYLKVLMDLIFGKELYKNHITWKRTSSKNDGTLQQFGRTSDFILFYSASSIDRDAVKIDLDKEYVDSAYSNYDKHWKMYWASGDVTGPRTSTGESGQSWGDFDPTKNGRCWSVPKTGDYAKWINKQIPGYLAEKSIIKRLDMLQDAKLIHWTKNGVPRLKRFLVEGTGQVPTDIWTDIPPVSSHSKEKQNYPTQKPLALLRRIINATTKQYGWVFDPFCGCATTLIAAEELQRQWVGIDLSPLANTLVSNRMRNELGLVVINRTHRTDIPMRTDMKIPAYNSAENKKQLYADQIGYCWLCFTNFEPRHLVIDHIVPKKQGGTDHIENLQLLCGNCNSIKGAGTMEEAIVKRQQQDKDWAKKKEKVLAEIQAGFKNKGKMVDA